MNYYKLDSKKTQNKTVKSLTGQEITLLMAILASISCIVHCDRVRKLLPGFCCLFYAPHQAATVNYS